jgi:hypothetical protein
VKCPRGPAAVNGDETRDGHWYGCEASFVKREAPAFSREIRFTRYDSRACWEGAGSRVNHEPEYLLGELTIVPSRAGEQARMKKRVQSSGSYLGLGDFLFLSR